MLCCGCLFVELIDRREGVLAERRTRRGKVEAGFLEGGVTCFLVIEPLYRLFLPYEFLFVMCFSSVTHHLCSRHLNGCFWRWWALFRMYIINHG